MDSFDFDTWAELAKTNPERFEQERRKMLEGMIENGPLAASAKAQLRSVLFDEKRLQQEPMAAAVSAQQAMWASFGHLQQEFVKLESAVAPLAPEQSSTLALLTKVV